MQATVSELLTHPLNESIYGLADDLDNLIESVKAKGILTPITITKGKVVVSGHRRILAAKEVGLKTVPAFMLETDDLLEIEEILILSNEQRSRTIEQKMREGKRLVEIEKERAKARQACGQGGVLLPVNLPEGKGDSRDIAAGKIGMSGKTLERGIEVLEVMDGIKGIEPEKAAEIKTALNKSVNSAASIVKPIVEAKKKVIAEGKKKVIAEGKSAKYEVEETDDHLYIQRPINNKYRPSFNPTNENIEWAKWSWNPVTGCRYGCSYCYARAMAENDYYSDTFLTKFEPTFHPGRLSCPDNHVIPTSRKSEPGINNVFLCSMAELWGDWVPDEWILQILEVIGRHPEYNFIALTKNPKRYLDFTFPENIWLGATADTQDRFDGSLEVFRLMSKNGCGNIKFLSCEPLLEKIDFIDDCGEFEDFDADNMYEYEECMERYNDYLSHLENEHRTKTVTFGYVDWVIIGGLKGSENSDKQPEWKWVEKLIQFARKSNATVYFKTNLTVTPKELPIGAEAAL